jgi:TatD DNase family protein
MPQYFDIHSHINAPEFDLDREEVIQQLRSTETYTIVVGTDLESSGKAVALADQYREIYACIGIHPVDNPSQNFEKEKFEKLIKHPKVVAVGECGFDFYHAQKDEDFGRQQRLFIEQIEFALAYNKPVMIHARNAYEEILEVLETFKSKYGTQLRGNVHFFAGTIEVAARLLAIGFSISFTGVITFTHDYDAVIKWAPLGMIMSETDSPFVTPVPYRGQRNEPYYVNRIVAKIAEIRGEDEGMVRGALVSNALSMIG